MTNLLTPVPKRSQPDVATMVRTIYKQLSPGEVHAHADRVITQLQEHFPQAAPPQGDRQMPFPTFSPSPLSRYLIGRSCGPTTLRNASTRRSVVAPTGWTSSPTGPRPGAWWASASGGLAEQHHEWAEGRRYLTFADELDTETLPSSNILEAAD